MGPRIDSNLGQSPYRVYIGFMSLKIVTFFATHLYCTRLAPTGPSSIVLAEAHPAAN